MIQRQSSASASSSHRKPPAGIEGGGSFTDLWTGGRVRAEGLTVPAGGFLWLLDASPED